jgi:hypothetical protein
MCLVAETCLVEVHSKENLVGTTNFWKLVIFLCPFLFQVHILFLLFSLLSDVRQVAASIYQTQPDSAIFRLPAFQNLTIHDWMKNNFPGQMRALEVTVEQPIDVSWVQDQELRRQLEQL